MIRKFKIQGLPTDKEFSGMPFGRRIDHLRTIGEFKLSCKSIHLSQKRQSYTKAIREAIKLYDVNEYFCEFCHVGEGNGIHDDSFQFWYR